MCCYSWHSDRSHGDKLHVSPAHALPPSHSPSPARLVPLFLPNPACPVGASTIISIGSAHFVSLPPSLATGRPLRPSTFIPIIAAPSPLSIGENARRSFLFSANLHQNPAPIPLPFPLLPAHDFVSLPPSPSPSHIVVLVSDISFRRRAAGRRPELPS